MQTKSYGRTSLGITLETITSMIDPQADVLETGCSNGYVTRYLKEELGCRVTAVEIDAEQAAKAEPYAEKLVVGDLNSAGTWDRIDGKYDYVLFADVLEHLVDPWEALRRSSRLLKPGGSVLASVPNVAFYKVRLGLLLGKFEYTDYGILDDTHLRFFTARTVRELFEKTGYTVECFHRLYQGRKHRALGLLFPDAFSYQFVVKAVGDAGVEN